ncbi:MAG: hypothetical protein JO223_21650 [Hyphomicrobiales bacterium]|nr:hypothetical protein [Hyphomicrobiales bacterium]MBV8441789.1 hypothetical protein [Hyphomicrobiales bacterium]
MQPSLFTRLTAVEAELRAMKDMLDGLKVNQDQLRRDRDEWRWRAERLLADQEQGAWWRWRRQAGVTATAVAAGLYRLHAEMQNKLAAMKASRNEPRQNRDEWLSRDRPRLMDRRKPWRPV